MDDHRHAAQMAAAVGAKVRDHCNGASADAQRRQQELGDPSKGLTSRLAQGPQEWVSKGEVQGQLQPGLPEHDLLVASLQAGTSHLLPAAAAAWASYQAAPAQGVFALWRRDWGGLGHSQEHAHTGMSERLAWARQSTDTHLRNSTRLCCGRYHCKSDLQGLAGRSGRPMSVEPAGPSLSLREALKLLSDGCRQRVQRCWAVHSSQPPVPQASVQATARSDVLCDSLTKHSFGRHSEDRRAQVLSIGRTACWSAAFLACRQMLPAAP